MAKGKVMVGEGPGFGAAVAEMALATLIMIGRRRECENACPRLARVAA